MANDREKPNDTVIQLRGTVTFADSFYYFALLNRAGVAQIAPLARPPRGAYHQFMATAPAPPRLSVLNLPNALTTSRLVLAVILFVCISAEWWPAGLLVF